MNNKIVSKGLSPMAKSCQKGPSPVAKKGEEMSILTLETKKYAIKIDNFEGPLDLLCHLIDKNKMNIYDINISEITDQYIEYLKEK